MPQESHLDLLPPLVEPGCFDELVNAGQTISAVPSCLDNSLAFFITSKEIPKARQRRNPTADVDQPIYFAGIDEPPSSERRLLITDTLLIFAAMQNLKKTIISQELEWIPNDDTVTMVRKLSIDYVNFIKECWVHASQSGSRKDPLQFGSEHYRILYTCFSLFVVLHLPEPGYEQAPVGDDLIEWLNIHFIEPSTEEGDQLSALERPWEHDNFWPYLTRTVLRGLSKASLFFCGVLANHPSEDLQDLAALLIPLIETQPRLQNFSAERDFVFAARRWNDKVKALRVDMDRIPEDERADGLENWWDRLSDIVGILEGRPEVLMRVCEELSADWKEICVAWTIFIDPRLRRQDLADIVSQVSEDMPPDPTSLEDMIHFALFSGDMDKALQQASQIDQWLSAHFADIMDCLSLIETEPDDDSGISKRDHYILSYAGHLHSDPALWRITIDYMYSCDDIGKSQADEVLLRVPLRLRGPGAVALEQDNLRSGEVVGILKDVNQACFDYQRESVRRTVCKIAAQSLVDNKEYGLALSYCASAEDWVGLGHIVDRVLDEYVTHGPQKFSEYASAIAPSIQELRIPHGAFALRLMFVVRYARFHQLLRGKEYEDAAGDLLAIFQEDLAPKSWWSIILYDTLPLLQYGPSLLFTSTGVSLLMRKVEEISVRTMQGCGDDYLSVLIRVIKGGSETEALSRLQVVRLALARYFSRCFVVGAGRMH